LTKCKLCLIEAKELHFRNGKPVNEN